MRNFIDKFVGKMKTYILCSKFLFFFSENCAFHEIMGKKYGRFRHATIIRRMRVACWITKAADTHTHTHTLRICNIDCFFHGNNGDANASQCYLIRILPVLFIIVLVVLCAINVQHTCEVV